MPFENRTWKFLVPVVGTLFLAAACSSSDNPGELSESGFLDGPSTPGPDDAPEQNIAHQTARAAAADPVGNNDGGGVSQGATVVAPFEWGVSTTDGVETFTFDLSDSIGILGAGVEYEVREGSAPAGSYVVERSIEDRIVTLTDPDPLFEGTLYVWASDGTENFGEDSDYLAYGFWLVDPDGTDADDLPVIGTFVDSNTSAAFMVGNLQALENDAEYSGGAEGLYHSVAGETSTYAAWTAAAALTASFSDASTIGTIEGTINTFLGLPDGVDSPTIALASTGISDSLEGGFFTGDTNAMVTIGEADPAPYMGKWGGKFYVDGTAATDHPGWVAGTFGLRSPMSDATATRAFLGVFTADLEE